VSESSKQSAELMRRITAEIWDNGRVDLIDELLAEDLINHFEVPGIDGTGREQYRAQVEMTRSAFPDFRNPLDYVVAEGDLAVSYGRMVGTNTGEMMGMPPTGKTIDLPVFGMLRFSDGRAIERWGSWDTMAYSQQLGLLG